MVIGHLDAGQSQSVVVEALKVYENVISLLCNRFSETRNGRSRLRLGCTPETTQNGDRCLRLTVVRKSTVNAALLKQQLQTVIGIYFSFDANCSKPTAA